VGTPFKLSASLELPGAPGLPKQLIPIVLSDQYAHKVEVELVLPASTGTVAVPFGTIPAAGAKVVCVFYELDADAPNLELSFNGGNEPLELSPGGFLVYASPVPDAGIATISIGHTGAGRLWVWLLA